MNKKKYETPTIEKVEVGEDLCESDFEVSEIQAYSIDEVSGY